MVRRSAAAVLALATLAALPCACVQRTESRVAGVIDAATVALRRGDAAGAESLVAEGLALTKSNPQSVAAFRLRLLRADVLLGRRELAQTTEIAQASIPDGAEYRSLRARREYLKARIEYVQNHLPQALTIANDAARDADAGSELQLEIEGFAGQLGLQLGRPDADARLQTVIEKTAAAGYANVEAMALISQGMGKFVRNRCDEALQAFERVVSSKAVEGTTVHAKALHNSGMCYARLGQFDRAIAAQRRAVKALEARPTSGDYEQALGQLGTTYLLQGNTREGLDLVQRAFKAASDSNLTADAALWAGNLAKAYIDLQQWDDAERFNEEATRRLATSRGGRRVYMVEYAAAVAAGRGQLDQATTLYREAIAAQDAPPSVVWHAHFGLATIARDRKQPAAAAKEFEAALDVIERTRSGLLKDDYKVTYLTQLISFYQAYVEALLAEGLVDKALEVADSSRGRVLAERHGAVAPRRATAAEMRRLARETGAVYLSYWVTPSRSYLFSVTRDRIAHVTLPPSAELEVLVRAHQEALANALVDPLAARDSAGDKLYRALVAPVASELPPNAAVVLMPDGPLHGINFETLPVDQPRRHYWIEDVEAQIAPSFASLIRRPPATKAEPSLLLIGNPTAHDPEFPDLKFAPVEMTSIARHFSAASVTTIDRDRATPASYRDARPDRFGFVHFAAHATANRESPLDSAVILSGPESSYKLYARDVAALPLAAELVTVSACRSAGERAYSGEGLVGFAWAFLRAGAHRVIAGLWDVNDRSTALLMEKLYERLAAGTPPPRALREAKLDLVHDRSGLATPYAWGAFELFTVTP